MKLKVTVTDACIFIDLYDLDLLTQFFSLDIEVHTTTAVIYELYVEQQKILRAYQSVGQLVVHNLMEQDFLNIRNEQYPRSLSITDMSVLYIANQLGACVLSSDKTLRNCAKNRAIEYHGMVWIFDRLVDTSLLSRKEAATKLEKLAEENFTFRNNRVLMAEIQKRLRAWR